MASYLRQIQAAYFRSKLQSNAIAIIILKPGSSPHTSQTNYYFVLHSFGSVMDPLKFQISIQNPLIFLQIDLIKSQLNVESDWVRDKIFYRQKESARYPLLEQLRVVFCCWQHVWNKTWECGTLHCLVAFLNPLISTYFLYLFWFWEDNEAKDLASRLDVL